MNLEPELYDPMTFIVVPKRVTLEAVIRVVVVPPGHAAMIGEVYHWLDELSVVFVLRC